MPNTRGAVPVILYAALVIAPLLVARLMAGHTHNILESIGKNAALAGLTILFLQPLAASRYKWLTQPFGLDITLRFHRNMAILALCLLLAHPVLIAAGEGEWGLLYRLDLPWYIWAGKLALLGVVVMVAVALLMSRLPISFERWFAAHKLAGPTILVIGFTHSVAVHIWKTGGGLLVLWSALFLGAVAVWLHHNVLRPRTLAQHPWEVVSVTRETGSVWTLEFAPPQGQPYKYLPGQFHFVTLLRGRDLPEEEHHFTISSSPENAATVTSTIKESGDFTALVGQTRKGDKAILDGPYGRFTHTLHPEETARVFIAGGIGITPVLSMLRHMRDTGDATPATLLYANSTPEDIVRRDELREMETDPTLKLRVAHVISTPGNGWDGETGHIDRARIEQYAGPITPETGFYICGPEPLREKVIAILQDMGVDDARIHFEIFRLL